MLLDFLALALLCLSIVATFALLNRARNVLAKARQNHLDSAIIPISIIRPVRSPAELNWESIDAWLNQDYLGPVEFIIAFDESHEFPTQLQEFEMNDRRVRIVSRRKLTGWTSKASNLFWASRAARFETLVWSENEVTPTPHTLRELAYRILAKPDALVVCHITYWGARNFLARCYEHFMNTVMLLAISANVLNRTTNFGMAGGTLALRKKTLRELGGVFQFANYLADEIRIGQLARARSVITILGPEVTISVGDLSRKNIAAKLNRFNLSAIWQLPSGLLLIGCLHLMSLIPWLLLVTALVWNRPTSLVIAFVLLVLKVFLGGRLEAMVHGRMQFAKWNALLNDIVSFGFYVRAALASEVMWETRKLTIRPHGKISQRLEYSPGVDLEEEPIKNLQHILS